LKLEVERFKVLSENIQDEELAVFYRDLMESEAGHYTTFITYARKYGTGIDVRKRWREWIDFEASIIEITVKRNDSRINGIGIVIFSM
jgi:tRNA-(ms[2]io[6]A)-hydroxylase